MKGGVLERPISETPFAVIDLETTGLNAGTDRVVEVAVIRKEPGENPRLVIDTLINPHRRVSGTKIHGITDKDVQDAPSFQEIIPEITRALDGSVVAAYNVYFDIRFLEDEFNRVQTWREIPHICLMYLRPMLGLGPRRSLIDVCMEHSVHVDCLHCAAADASACSHLLQLYLGELERKGLNTFAKLASLQSYKFLDSLGSEPLSASYFGPLRECTRQKPRARSVDSKCEQERIALAAYWDTLTAALSDLNISEDERKLLFLKRRQLKLKEEQVRMLHGQAFAAAINRFADDHWIDEEECRKLAMLHSCLGDLGWAPGLQS